MGSAGPKEPSVKCESRSPIQGDNFDGERAARCKVWRLSAESSVTKTAEPIEMPFGVCIRVGPRKHVLDGSAQWRHVANTIEPSMCGSDAACGQITLTTYYRCCHSGL